MMCELEATCRFPCWMHADYGCVPDGIDEDLLQYSVLIDHDKRLTSLEDLTDNYYVVLELILLSLAILCVLIGILAKNMESSQRVRQRSRRRKPLEWEGNTFLLIPNDGRVGDG
jgi:hypothetical protein